MWAASERLAPVNVRAQFFLPHNAPVVGNVARGGAAQQEPAAT